MTALIVYPLVQSVILSLRPGRFLSVAHAKPGFGLEQYAAVLTNSSTWAEFGKSAIYVTGTILPALLLGLGLALLLRNPFPGRRWLRTLILLPWAVPGVAASTVFLWMLDSAFGIVNKVLLAVGVLSAPVAWYGQTDTAMFSVIVPTAWKLYPLFVMAFIAALQTIPLERYEAARIDGASRWAQFRFVTWPGIRLTGYIVTVIAVLGVFREFDYIFPLTAGGPSDSTMTLAIGIYLQAFQFSNVGYAAALGIVCTVVAAVVAFALSYRMSRKDA